MNEFLHPTRLEPHRRRHCQRCGTRCADVFDGPPGSRGSPGAGVDHLAQAVAQLPGARDVEVAADRHDGTAGHLDDAQVKARGGHRRAGRNWRGMGSGCFGNGTTGDTTGDCRRTCASPSQGSIGSWLPRRQACWGWGIGPFWVPCGLSRSWSLLVTRLLLGSPSRLRVRRWPAEREAPPSRG